MPARHCQMHFYKYFLTTVSEKAQSELEELMEARGDKDGSANYIAVFIKMLQINMRRIEERINIENIADDTSAMAKPARNNQSANINITTSTNKSPYLDKLIKDDDDKFPYTADGNENQPKETPKRNNRNNRRYKKGNG